MNRRLYVANTSFADDQGKKRLLYEDLGVKEYWILNVQNMNLSHYSKNPYFFS
ncbi:Uma2 family endonuclease [Nostoc sp.]|uniref:Uma2 family endonuclease n=1 Tax=Nostoc sp. TaxID=1180 RepID=UPI002FF61EF7